MSYVKATHILPAELLERIQQYVDGQYLYIPRMEEKRKNWGEGTSTREELSIRNGQIYLDYLNGYSQNHLTEKYYLSLKSIQRIIRQERQRQ